MILQDIPLRRGRVEESIKQCSEVLVSQLIPVRAMLNLEVSHRIGVGGIVGGTY